MLPETSGYTARMTASGWPHAGRPMQVLTAEGHRRAIAGTALLVSERVGTYPTSEPLADAARLAARRPDATRPGHR